MTHEPLPEQWQRPFAVREAVDAGVARGRLRGIDLRREFHGLRVPEGWAGDLRGRCRALQVVLDDRHAFTGPTAAQLWGMPIPRRLERIHELHVASAYPTRATRHRNTIGTERPETWRVTERNQLRVHAPIETWASLARHLDIHDLVAVADFIVTPPSPRGQPLANPHELTQFVANAAGMTGVARLRTALRLSRVGPRSRPETLLRLLLGDAVIPVPELNASYILSSGRTAIPDLSWPEFRVAVEYDGDYHRDRTQHRRDLVRTEEMVDDGWLVVHVIDAQLFGRPSEIVARLNKRLSSRGARTKSVTRFAHFEP